MSTAPILHQDPAVNSYVHWLASNTHANNLANQWREIMLPFVDGSHDGIIIYAKDDGGETIFTDDGFTLATLENLGLSLSRARRDQIARIAQRFGAGLQGEELTLTAPSGDPDGLHRFIQAYLAVDGMREIHKRKVAAYFADDVAESLDALGIYYTPSINIRGKSNLEHHFDFVFQRSRSHPTRFCVAPNVLDERMVKSILFSWDDTKLMKERHDSLLYVIGDDRHRALPDTSLRALNAYGVKVLGFSQLDERAVFELAS